eukprot:scaffold200356_cov19-Tisochrysis_lutea.AAC.1
MVKKRKVGGAERARAWRRKGGAREAAGGHGGVWRQRRKEGRGKGKRVLAGRKRGQQPRGGGEERRRSATPTTETFRSLRGESNVQPGRFERKAKKARRGRESVAGGREERREEERLRNVEIVKDVYRRERERRKRTGSLRSFFCQKNGEYIGSKAGEEKGVEGEREGWRRGRGE